MAPAILTVVARWVLTTWLDRPIAPTWVTLAFALGGLGPFVVRPLGPGGFGGFLVALVVLRFGALDADGAARRGVLGGQRSPSAHRAVPLAGLVLAGAYGITHPVRGPGGGSGGADVVRGAERSVRSFFLPIEPQGLGEVSVLAVRTAGDAATRTRVLAAGEPASDGPPAPPRGFPVAATSPVELWLSVPRCPAPPISADRFDVRVRSWSGTHWVPVRLKPDLRLRCAP